MFHNIIVIYLVHLINAIVRVLIATCGTFTNTLLIIALKRYYIYIFQKGNITYKTDNIQQQKNHQFVFLCVYKETLLFIYSKKTKYIIVCMSTVILRFYFFEIFLNQKCIILYLLVPRFGTFAPINISSFYF